MTPLLKTSLAHRVPLQIRTTFQSGRGSLPYSQIRPSLVHGSPIAGWEAGHAVHRNSGGASASGLASGVGVVAASRPSPPSALARYLLRPAVRSSRRSGERAAPRPRAVPSHLARSGPSWPRACRARFVSRTRAPGCRGAPRRVGGMPSAIPRFVHIMAAQPTLRRETTVLANCSAGRRLPSAADVLVESGTDGEPSLAVARDLDGLALQGV